MTAASKPGVFDPEVRAVLLDLDGVITDTASVHGKAWKQLFDGYLATYDGTPEQRAPFRLPEDYATYVDGRPRYEGVQTFLRSRGIDLPWGATSDPADSETVCGLGNNKNGYFNQVLDEQGVEVFERCVQAMRQLKARGVKLACVSSSKNCRRVLERAGLIDLFDTIYDGTDLEREGVRGKPHPDTYLRAAERLGVPKGAAVVVEDATAGVAAGRAGDFGLVVGIDRGAGEAALKEHGADIVVGDFGDCAPAQT